MNKVKKNRIRIAWWVMRLTVYVFLGFYFTFDSTNYPDSMSNVIGIALLVIGVIDTFWLFKKIGE
jgi:uncharacterized membrane protein HdeD (DUF308 family)